MNCRVKSGGKNANLTRCTYFIYLFISFIIPKDQFNHGNVQKHICNVPIIMLVIGDNQIANVLFKFTCESFIYEVILVKMVKP